MIIQESNKDYQKLLKNLSELKNKKIFQAYQTFGSMFLFDFGKKYTKLTKRKLSFYGENTIIVEDTSWNLMNNNNRIVNNVDTQKEIAKQIPQIIGQKITNVIFDKNKLEIDFIMTGNFNLIVSLTNNSYRDIGIKLANGNWLDIGPNQEWKIVSADHVD